MQDNAIAQMTISDLEQKLEKRVQMFDGLRTKVETETKQEVAVKHQQLEDDLTELRAKQDELETTVSAQRQDPVFLGRAQFCTINLRIW